MKNKKRVIAIIPARSGSKGLKNKNILILKGKPLIYYPIKAAKKSNLVDDVVVSTDSKKYKKIAEKYGAKCPFLRPKKISSDNSSSFDVVDHVIRFFKNRNIFYDYLVLLEPTSPKTTYIDINNALKKILSKKYISLVSVAKASKFYSESFFKIKNNMIKMQKKNVDPHKRRQKFNEYYMDGSLYISKVKDYLKNKGFISKKTYGYIVKDKIKNIEIDDIYDLKIIKEAS